MALQLILGNAGAGKSHYIFEKIIQESMEHPTKQYLIIVPEQFHSARTGTVHNADAEGSGHDASASWNHEYRCLKFRTSGTPGLFRGGR